MNILVTGACGVTSRAIARSLRMSTYFGASRLIGTDICENLFGVREGLFDKIFKVPRWDDRDYLPLMEAILEREQVHAAVVIPEPEVLLWSECMDRVPVLLPPPRLARLAISKSSLYHALTGTGLVPSYRIVSRAEILQGRRVELPMPFWLRDCTPGSTSGRGALKVHDTDEARAWALLQKEVRFFMASEFLPGRNLACCLLFDDNELVKWACAERLTYFGGHLVLSGITGNTSKGRLVNDDRARTAAEKCLRLLARATGERLEGLFTVDLREDNRGRPLVTEVNLRHVAFTSAFAQAGVNMAEAQLLATLGLGHRISREEVLFPDNNLFLRDIDGLPQWESCWRPQMFASEAGPPAPRTTAVYEAARSLGFRKRPPVRKAPLAVPAPSEGSRGPAGRA